MHEEETVAALLPMIRGVVDDVMTERGLRAEIREELISDGFLGALIALRRFDPTHGVSLANFARYRVKGQILDGLRTRSGMRHDAVTGKVVQRGLQLSFFPTEDLESTMDPRDDYDVIEQRDVVRRLFGELSVSQRDLLVDHYVLEKPAAAIARDHRTTAWKVKTALRHALSDARSILEGNPMEKRRRQIAVDSHL